MGAQDLQTGNVVTTPTGGTAVVVGNVSQLLAAPITVYNIQVASDHTYFVEDGQGAQTPVGCIMTARWASPSRFLRALRRQA